MTRRPRRRSAGSYAEPEELTGLSDDDPGNRSPRDDRDDLPQRIAARARDADPAAARFRARGGSAARGLYRGDRVVAETGRARESARLAGFRRTIQGRGPDPPARAFRRVARRDCA